MGNSLTQVLSDSSQDELLVKYFQEVEKEVSSQQINSQDLQLKLFDISSDGDDQVFLSASQQIETPPVVSLDSSQGFHVVEVVPKERFNLFVEKQILIYIFLILVEIKSIFPGFQSLFQMSLLRN